MTGTREQFIGDCEGELGSGSGRLLCEALGLGAGGDATVEDVVSVSSLTWRDHSEPGEWTSPPEEEPRLPVPPTPAPTPEPTPAPAPAPAPAPLPLPLPLLEPAPAPAPAPAPTPTPLDGTPGDELLSSTRT